MSTPTTATATLAPQYNPQHYPHYSHHPQYQSGSSSAYRQSQHPVTTVNGAINTGSVAISGARLPPPYPQQPQQQPHLPHPVSQAPSHYAALPAAPPTALPAPAAALIQPTLPPPVMTTPAHASGIVGTASTGPSSVPRSDAQYSPAMSGQSSQQEPNSRKRRRGADPDWTEFYRNGLPKEIIVIDDSPEPDSNGIGAAYTTTKSSTTNAAAGAITAGAAPPVAKRRKRESDVAASNTLRQEPLYDQSRQYIPPGGTPQGQHHYSPTATASNSSGRNTSAVQTTAATSIGSSSSTSQYEYDAGAGQKRKRATRQTAQETRRQQAEALQDIVRYKTPDQPIKKSGEIKVRVIHEPYRNRNIKYDDDDGHYVVVPDADLTDDYQMIQLLGQGTFGKVVKALDKRRNKLVAVKIIRSVQKYRDASRIELRVLATLKANDSVNRNRCIHLRDCFDYRSHICIVMDLLDKSVFDFLKGNQYVPFPNSQIQSFARQLFTSVAFLHDLNLIHTDLKPENILLCNSAYQTFTYNRKVPSSSTTASRSASQRKVLLDTEIRLIDFGSATFNDEYHSSVVSTRHYRAPEIILGLGWSFECDIWSIGCILVEFFTGDALFQTHDNLEHLAMMEAVVGSRIDQHLVQQVNKMTRNGGNPASQYFKRYKLDYPAPDTPRGSKRFVKGMKHIKSIIPSNNGFLRNFLDLLEKIFVYDPKKRIKAKEALKHPWFHEAAYPDDGTEAAKIKRERSMAPDAPGSRTAPLQV